jgi:hypothetical protein
MSLPTSGKMTWAQALAGPLAGATCLWQDLDGLHVEPALPSPPPTSALWGWRDDGILIRARLDGETAYVTIHDPAAKHDQAGPRAGFARTLPWSPSDDRVAANHGRGPTASHGGVGAAYEQIVVDGGGHGTGPITFVRPAAAASPRVM